MTMSEKIRQKRRALGMTQEQIAGMLHVSAPAVNKWEKGVTSPDVALLPALARLLKMDLNELFGFHENLTLQEIAAFLEQVAKAMGENGEAVTPERVDAAFAMIRDRIDEYPNCFELIHNCALMMDGTVMMSALTKEQKEAYETEILSMYERAAASDDPQLRSNVNFMLASKYLGKDNLEKAQEILDLIPQHSAIDKRMLQATLLEKQEKFDEAISLMQRNLYQTLSETLSVMARLTELEIAAGHTDRAQQIAEIAADTVDAVHFWEYYRYIALLDTALAKKDVQESTALIDRLFASCGETADVGTTPLYDRIGLQEAAMTGVAQRIIPPLLAEMERDEKFGFLKGEEAFEALVKKYAAVI